MMARSGYFDPNNAGSANLGTFDDPWTDVATAEAGTAAGEEIWCKPGIYTIQMDVAKAGTDCLNKINWIACTADGSRWATPSEIINDGVKVIIDCESTRAYGIKIPICCLFFWGFEVHNSTQDGWLLDDSVNVNYLVDLYYCGAHNCSNIGFNGAAGNHRNSIVHGFRATNCDVGLNGPAVSIVRFSMAKNCTTKGLVGRTDAFIYNCFVVSCPTGIETGNNARLAHNSVYDASVGIKLGFYAASVEHHLENCSVLALDHDSRPSNVSEGNSFFNNTANVGNLSLSKSGSNVGYYYLNELTKSKLLDPTNGNYMSDPANDESRNIEYPIDSTNSAFLTTGIQPVEASGSDGRTVLIKKFYNML